MKLHLLLSQVNIVNVRSGFIIFDNDYDILTDYEVIEYLGIGKNTFIEQKTKYPKNTEHRKSL